MPAILRNNYKKNDQLQYYSEKFVLSLRTVPQVVTLKADIYLREILHLYMFISVCLNCDCGKIFYQMWP